MAATLMDGKALAARVPATELYGDGHSGEAIVRALCEFMRGARI